MSYIVPHVYLMCVTGGQLGGKPDDEAHPSGVPVRPVCHAGNTGGADLHQ